MTSQGATQTTRGGMQLDGRLLLGVLALVLTVGAILAHRYSNVAIVFDGDGYYAYLPAWLVNHDPGFGTLVREQFHGSSASIFFQQSNGNYLDKYPIGTALLILPFFIAGEAVNLFLGHDVGGYATASQIAVSFSMIFYTVVGMWALHAALRCYFSQWVTLATLVAVLFGTDLFHYTTHEPAFSHTYSFGIVALFVLTTQRWYQGQRSIAMAAAIGALSGMIVIIRPSNVVLLLVIPLMGVTSWATARQQWRQWLRHKQQVAVMLATAFAVVTPQLAVWYIATGRPVVDAYADNHEYFHFASPHILDVLFSFYPHGVLPYAPILVLAVVGLLPLRRYAPHMVLPLLVILPLNLYVIASWYEWYYGGGYGLRVFIDSLPLMAFPIAAVVASARRPAMRAAVWGFIAASVTVVFVMMVHYWRREVFPDGVSAPDYFRILFGR